MWTGTAVEFWQIALMAFFVLLPVALLLDFWPHRDRLDYRGVPADRDWVPQIEHEPADEDHH